MMQKWSLPCYRLAFQTLCVLGSHKLLEEHHMNPSPQMLAWMNPKSGHSSFDCKHEQCPLFSSVSNISSNRLQLRLTISPTTNIWPDNYFTMAAHWGENGPHVSNFNICMNMRLKQSCSTTTTTTTTTTTRLLIITTTTTTTIIIIKYYCYN